MVLCHVYGGTGGGGGGFFLTCKDFEKMFDHSFPTSAFLVCLFSGVVFFLEVEISLYT